jgi:Histidine kinase
MSDTQPVSVGSSLADAHEPTSPAREFWFNYFAKPVFSAEWRRGRLRSLGSLCVGVYCFVAIAMWSGGVLPGDLVRMFAGLFTVLAVPMVCGPALAAKLADAHGSEVQRRRRMLYALILIAAVAVATDHWAVRPLIKSVNNALGWKQSVNAQETSESRPSETDDFCCTGPDGKAMQQRAFAGLNWVFRGLGLALKGLMAYTAAGGFALYAYRAEKRKLAFEQQQRELAEAQAARRETELRLSGLAAQVEPHFLFNTLAGLRSAVESDSARAIDLIDGLVEYFRASIPTLRDGHSTQWFVGAQFDVARAYLKLMRARLPRLSFTIFAPPHLLNARCPPLMLISLVENSVKHGVEPKRGATHIEVTASEVIASVPPQLKIVVRDDGAGFDADGAGAGIGLANIKERLQHMYGARASLSLEVPEHGGVQAVLTLPLEFETEGSA